MPHELTRRAPPELATDPIDPDLPVAPLLRQLLAEAGGISSARVLRDELAALRGEKLGIRRVREALRAPGVRKLGAGYFSLKHALFIPVLDWVEQRLLQHGPEPVDDLIAAVLSEYPRGDRLAVLRWLQQDPGRIQIDSRTARLTPQRWRRP